MKTIRLCLYFLLLALGEVKANLIHTNDVRNQDELSYNDLLITGLKREKWGQDEKLCIDTMILALESAKNSTLWAALMLNAMDLPTIQLYGLNHHLGNYDQCIHSDINIRIDHPEHLTQYCIADVTLTDDSGSRVSRDRYNDSINPYLEHFVRLKRNYAYIVLGVCVPRVCQQKTIPKILKVLLKNSYLGSLSDKAQISVSNCQPSARQYPTGYYVFMSMVVLLAATVVCCTFFVNFNNNNAIVCNSFIAELAGSFCLKRNMKTVTKVRNNEIKILNVIRLISCFAVVYAHVLIGLFKFSVNVLQMESILSRQTMNLNVVDSFFILSGLLFTRGFLDDKLRNPFIHMWKRLIRLGAGFAIVIFFATSVANNIGDGPMWRLADKEQKICENNFWLNLFMLGNYHVDKLCSSPLWYVPCDYQLCLLATFIFYMYNKKKVYGIYTFVIVFVIGVSYTGILTYWNNWRIMIFDGQETIINIRENVSLMNLYQPAEVHIGPFMLGMLTAYLLYTHNPADYRNVISKKWSYAGVMVGLSIMCSIMLLTERYYGVHGTVEGAIFISLNRVVWAIGICIIIVISEYGTLPILDDVFAWYPFSVLSRITFGVYLVHLLILENTLHSLRDNITFYMLNLIINVFGLMVFSFVISLLMWLLIEAPLINVNNLLLERMFLKGKSPDKVATSHKDVQEKKKN